MALAARLSAYNRERKWSLFLREVAPSPELKILDVGFAEREYSAVDNYIEKRYPFPGRVTALGLDYPTQFKRRYPRIRPVRYDGGPFPFGNKAFDVCWSNAVVEHVGNRERQAAFVQEMVRVSRKVLFSTPNRHFPVEVHTRIPLLHWLPKAGFDLFLKAVGKAWATGDYMHLLSRRDLVSLLTSARVSRYRVVRNRVLGMTMDFVVIIDD